MHRLPEDGVAEVNRAAFTRGASFGGPTLWLCGTQDTYYRISHCRSVHEAFVEAGGKGRFERIAIGHNLITNTRLWIPHVDGFLDEVAGVRSSDGGRPVLDEVAGRGRRRLPKESIEEAHGAFVVHVVGLIRASTREESETAIHRANHRDTICLISIHQIMVLQMRYRHRKTDARGRITRPADHFSHHD